VNKRFFPEIIGFLFVFLLAFLISGKPEIPKFFSSPTNKKLTPTATPKKLDPIKLIRTEALDSDLKDRNIFDSDGIYLKPGEVKKPPPPENPYTLIGILEGKERKAVFRDYTGAVVVLDKGKKMIDEAVITRIDARSVIIKKDEKEKEVRIFQFQAPKPLYIKNP
jgi:hypothetical protein